MGIYDREYYRREGPSILDAWSSHGKVCKWLIGVNLVVFLLQAVTASPDGPADLSLTGLFILDTQKVWQGEVWRLLTYAFLHSQQDIWHLVINMAVLWWLGSDVEDLYGPREFLAFYLAAALAGGLAFQLLHNPGFCLGASGAVWAVSVLCAMHFPTRTILVFFVLPMQIWLMVVLFIAYDAYVLLTHQVTGTAVEGHLGGALFGFLYYQANIRLLNFLPDVGALKRKATRPRLRIVREDEPAPVQAAPVIPVPFSRDVDEQLEAKLDAVLEKVARFGQSSLTDGERQILFRASEIYKKRRTLDS